MRLLPKLRILGNLAIAGGMRVVGHFPANAAWLTLAAVTANLTRAAGALASPFQPRARIATIRAGLISVAARIARHVLPAAPA